MEHWTTPANFLFEEWSGHKFGQSLRKIYHLIGSSFRNALRLLVSCRPSQTDSYAVLPVLLVSVMSVSKSAVACAVTSLICVLVAIGLGVFAAARQQIIFAMITGVCFLASSKSVPLIRLKNCPSSIWHDWKFNPRPFERETAKSAEFTVTYHQRATQKVLCSSCIILSRRSITGSIYDLCGRNILTVDWAKNRHARNLFTGQVICSCLHVLRCRADNVAEVRNGERHTNSSAAVQQQEHFQQLGHVRVLAGIRLQCHDREWLDFVFQGASENQSELYVHVQIWPNLFHVTFCFQDPSLAWFGWSHLVENGFVYCEFQQMLLWCRKQIEQKACCANLVGETKFDIPASISKSPDNRNLVLEVASAWTTARLTNQAALWPPHDAFIEIGSTCVCTPFYLTRQQRDLCISFALHFWINVYAHNPTAIISPHPHTSYFQIEGWRLILANTKNAIQLFWVVFND